MEIGRHWKTIQAIFEESLRYSFHYAVATVDENGAPYVTPIGALFLRDDMTGFYFDEFPIKTSNNLENDQRVCILAVNCDPTLWRNSIVKGKFESPPSVRLMGVAGAKRKATEDEVAMWHEHVEYARGTRGYQILWEKMSMVRDLYFDSFEPVLLGGMTQGLW